MAREMILTFQLNILKSYDLFILQEPNVSCTNWFECIKLTTTQEPKLIQTPPYTNWFLWFSKQVDDLDPNTDLKAYNTIL